MAYQIEKKLISGLPKTKLKAKNFIVAHETSNPNSTIDNEIAYMSRNWQNAFVTHFVGGGGRVVQIAPTGYASWGCGSKGNAYAYAQVELCRAKDKATFQKDYAAYCQLLVNLAKEAGIPITLDSGSGVGNRGIKSHDWIRAKLGGTTHTDPYGYLKQWGISKAQFEKDLVAASKGSTGNPNAISATVQDVAPLMPKPQFKSQVAMRLWKTGTKIKVYKYNAYWYKTYVPDKNGKLVLGYIYHGFLKNLSKPDSVGRISATVNAFAIFWDNQNLRGGQILTYKPGTKLKHYPEKIGLKSAYFTKQKKVFYTPNYWLK
ncbi:N-acetylmuramoyl-L-alanine amidase [Listeria aquatica]|uniref:N-acetylmuramoyl-L-alanine amidase n=1 Tax=Listeria aquatica TaxID=1494960 RepID=UPI003EF14D08